MLLLLFFTFAISGFCLDTSKTSSSQLHQIQLNNSAGVMSALESLPKECTKNGKKYRAGETFEIGSLRYKCQEYGVYTFEGCKRKDGKEMSLGESVVVDNIKYQCLSLGTSVFYKETTCGILGQPDCDKIPLPKGFEDAQKNFKPTSPGKTDVDGVHLPKGWSMVDGGQKQITGTNASVVTRILMFNPTGNRVKRDGFKGKGVGSVIGMESVAAEDIGKPLSSKGSSVPRGTAATVPQSSQSHPKVIGTQTVGAQLNMIKSGDKKDRDLVDLNSRHDQKMEGGEKLKAGSVRGSKSEVDWKGRKVIVNGKTIGAGPGTFTFGNRPTR